MITKAKKISERLKQENGVLNAIEAIYYELEYARSLILAKQHENTKHDLKSGTQTPVVNETNEYFDSDTYDADHDSDKESDHDQTYEQDNHSDYDVANDDNMTEIVEPSLEDGNDTVRIAPDSGNDNTTVTDANK